MAPPRRRIAKSHARDRALSRLTPGAGRDSFERILQASQPRTAGDHSVYVFLSLISSATRSLAAAHNRSTDLLEIFSASAVSSTVSPAK